MSILSDVREATAEILGSVRDLISVAGPTRNFSDMNKAANRDSLQIFSLVSNSVTTDVYPSITSGMEAQIAAAIKLIVNNTIEQNPRAAVDFIRNNFTNGNDIADKLHSGINSLSDDLSESGVQLTDLNIQFTSSLNEKTKYTTDDTDVVEVSDRYKKTAKNILKKGPAQVASTDVRTDTGENRATFRSRAIVQEFDINIVWPGSDGKPEAGKFTFMISICVNVLPVDTDKLLEAMASSKSRSIFNNYLTWRAGNIPFFKGFIMNLKEIERQVKRDTSKNMSERILGSLLSKSGFTRPKLIGEVTELKNYSIVLTSEDADRLVSLYGINLTRPSDLKKIFNTMNILTLVIYDEAKGRATFFNSDRPTQMTVVPVKALEDTKRLAGVFSKLSSMS